MPNPSQKIVFMHNQPLFKQLTCLLMGVALCAIPVVTKAGGIIKDVELTNSSTLVGRVVRPDGSAMSLASVQIRYQGKTIAVAQSAPNGQFAIEQVRGGLHEVVVAGHSSPVRFWTCGSAPMGCSPEFCAQPPVAQGPVVSQMPMAQGSFCPPVEGCQPISCAPMSQSACVQGSQFGMVDVITLTTLGTSVAALVVAIDAKSISSRALASGTSGLTSTSGGTTSTGNGSTTDTSSP